MEISNFTTTGYDTSPTQQRSRTIDFRARTNRYNIHTYIIWQQEDRGSSALHKELLLSYTMRSISWLALICLVLWLGGSCCEALSASSSPTTTSSHRSTLWNILETSDGVAQAFSTIFGMNGERGE